MRRILVAAAVVVLGSLVSVASPAQAASGPWSVVSTGALHTCAINTGKSLYCWGANGFGQIGDGTTTRRPSPTRIGSAGAWANVSAGYNHTCATTTGDSLYCWGYNGTGQIGDGTSGGGNDRHSPKKIGSSGVWAAAAAGGNHTCAITTGNSLYCWGYNIYGQVGDGTSGNSRPSPKKIGTSGVWAGVTTGELHTCAISTGKSLYCWGANEAGSLGDGTTTNRRSPTRIGSAGAWALASAGDYHSCAISTANSLYCWGYNNNGQVGDGTTTQRLSPKKIGTTGAWARINTGGTSGVYSHTCATTTGNSLYCWGNNSFGQIGDGTTTSPRLSPKKIGTTGVWAGAQAGGTHSCAITTAKSLYCWGYNGEGQIGDGTLDTRLAPKKIA
jgi:alpha-tubulin suppressor-like RCC1 family protein